jgi:hypothetical protein
VWLKLPSPVGFRSNLINKNAAEHLQPGEEIEQVAIVRAQDTGGTNYAVAATPSHVYVFALGGMGFAKVREVLTRIPIGKAVVERRASFLTVGRRGQEQPDHVFSTLPGAGPKRVAAYVTEHGGGSGQ